MAIILMVVSYQFYPHWITVILTGLLAFLSSREVLFTQIFLALIWMLLVFYPLPFFPALGKQEFLYRLFQGGTLLVLYFRGKPLIQSLSGRPGFALRASELLTGLAVCLSIACLFRSTSLLYAGWAVVLLAYAHLIQTVPLLKTLKTLIALGIPIVIVIAILEIGTRWLLPVEHKPGGLYLHDSEMIFTLRPEGENGYSFKDNSGNILVWRDTISAQGIRDREYGIKAPDEYRIVTLGDSYTMGQALKREDTFQRNLEQLLNAENLSKRFTVINCGVAGYAPWQERLFLQKRGMNFEPDLVLLQLFPPNDIAGSYAKVQKFLDAFNMEWEQRLLDFRRQREWPFSLERGFRNHSNLYRLWCNIMGQSGYVRNLVLNFRLLPAMDYTPPALKSARNAYQEACLVAWYPELYEAWELYAEDIRGIRDDCREHGIPLAAFVHGEYISLVPEFWESLNREFPDSPYEMNKDIRLTRELLSELEIPNTDVVAAFAAYPEPEDLYYLYEGHFTPRGARVLASCLCDFLLERLSNTK